MCCCARLHRHQIHLITYGIVSCGLITTGLVFTVFAIFQKDSQIGKVWLAGPTTMVVGLVLAGKVVIDWGPAMLHGRQGSIDSRFMDPMNMPRGQMNETSQIIRYDQQPKCNGSISGPIINHQTPNYMSPRLQRTSIGMVRPPPEHCLIYSQYNNSSHNLPIQQMNNHDRPSSSNRRYTKPDAYQRSSIFTNNSDNSAEQSIALTETCECCQQYGTMVRTDGPFQGESFVLNERSYLI